MQRAMFCGVIVLLLACQAQAQAVDKAQTALQDKESWPVLPTAEAARNAATNVQSDSRIADVLKLSQEVKETTGPNAVAAARETIEDVAPALSSNPGVARGGSTYEGYTPNTKVSFTTYAAKAAARLFDPISLGIILVVALVLLGMRRERRSWDQLGETRSRVEPGTRKDGINALQEGDALAQRLIPSTYRRLALEQGEDCAPTDKTSDARIMEIYQSVGSAFRSVANNRGELLPATWLNFIVWKFLQLGEALDATAFEQHLKYEVAKYLRDGLREDYRQDLRLL